MNDLYIPPLHPFAIGRRAPIPVLILDAGLSLVGVGGGSLHELREDVYDNANRANGRAGCQGIEANYAASMMGGEPYAFWH